MRYTDFLLLASEPHLLKADGKKRLTFNLIAPGIDEHPIACELDVKHLDDLKEKASGCKAVWNDARLLGEALAAALLPSSIWNALNNKITQAAGVKEGVRVRLMLSGSELNNWPWEFIVFNRAGGEIKASDFLALMPNVSLVRHKAASLPAWSTTARIPVRVLVVVASPSGWPKLEVAKERDIIMEALAGCGQLAVESVEHARRSQLPHKTNPVHLFHFAGHGKFEKEELSPVPGALAGKSSIILEDEYGDGDPLDAELLALQLRDAGVRVAVLGACLTAQRDDVNGWSSAAEALLKAEVGAVVAMQFPVFDKSARLFAERFYGALSVGLSIDEAVTAGRVAVAASDDPRGWATPVLHLRSPDGIIFPEFQANPGLAKQRETVRSNISNIRMKFGILEGTARAVNIGKIEGTDPGKTMTGIGQGLSSMKIEIEAGHMPPTGSATAVEIGSATEKRRRSNKSKPAARKRTEKRRRSNKSKLAAPERRG
jgi:hypothetical protein